jgi:hypothetical protein
VVWVVATEGSGSHYDLGVAETALSVAGLGVECVVEGAAGDGLAAAAAVAAAVVVAAAGNQEAWIVYAVPVVACIGLGGGLEGVCIGIEAGLVLAGVWVPYPAQLADCRRAGLACMRSCSAAVEPEKGGGVAPSWSSVDAFGLANRAVKGFLAAERGVGRGTEYRCALAGNWKGSHVHHGMLGRGVRVSRGRAGQHGALLVVVLIVQVLLAHEVFGPLVLVCAAILQLC